MIRRPLVLISALLTAGCGSVEGDVRDGMTGEPVPGARVTLHYTNDPSGFFSGRKTASVVTGATGAFAFERDSGHRLEIATPDGREATGSLCTQSPFSVFVGGPYPGMRLNRPLTLTSTGSPLPDELPAEGRLDASDLGLSVRQAGGGEGAALSFTADEGLIFVRGTGSVPMPPPLPYPKLLDVDLNKECGWIFVARDGRVAAVLDARTPHHLSTPSGYEESSLLFAELP